MLLMGAKFSIYVCSVLIGAIAVIGRRVTALTPSDLQPNAQLALEAPKPSQAPQTVDEMMAAVLERTKKRSKKS